MEYPWQTIIGEAPAKSNSYKVIKVNGITTLGKKKNVENYEKSFYMQVGQYRNLMIDGFFELHVRFFFSKMSHDLDNGLKSVLDNLQLTKTIKNDNKCVKIIAEKYIDKNNPRIEFMLRTI